MAIGIILGIVFALVCAGCVLATVCLVSGRRPLASAGNRRVTKKPVAGGITGAAAACAFILFLLIPFSFHTVQAGEVAVVKHLGEARNVRMAGTYFDFWVTESYEKYDAKVQNLEIRSPAYSKDAQTMDIVMTVQYQIDTSKAIEIATNYGGLETLSGKIESVTIEKTKSVLSAYSAMEIIETRASISPKVEEVVKKAIDANYYVIVNTVVLTNIDFSDAFEKTVEDKMIAEQEKLKAQYEKETAIINAEKEFEVAKKQAEAKIEVAKADAEAQKLIASAEAYATKIKIVELARSMGYTVKETVGTDEEPVYEIEWGTGTEAEASKKLLVNYLQYLEYLSKWDGKLPDVMMNEGNGTIMIPTPTNPTT